MQEHLPLNEVRLWKETRACQAGIHVHFQATFRKTELSELLPAADTQFYNLACFSDKNLLR